LKAALDTSQDDEERKADLLVQMLMHEPTPSAETFEAAHALDMQKWQDKVSGQRVRMAMLLSEGAVEKTVAIAEDIVKSGLGSSESRRARAHVELARADIAMSCAKTCAAIMQEAKKEAREPFVGFYGETAAGMRTHAMSSAMSAANNYLKASKLLPDDTPLREASEQSAVVRELDPMHIVGSRKMFWLANCGVYHGRVLDGCEVRKTKKRATS